MGVRIAELPSSEGISKTDLIIVQDNEATKQGTIQQLDDSLGVSRLREEFEAYQIQNNADELENQKFITQYVACMAGIELPVEEETEEMTHVQDFE